MVPSVIWRVPQAEAVSEVVDEMPIAIGEPSARQDIVENSLNKSVIKDFFILNLMNEMLIVKFL